MKIPQELVAEIVTLAKEYLPERFLPDSAIDLLDEASALRHSLAKGKELHGEINKKEDQLAKLCRQKETLILSEQYNEAVKARQEEQKLEKELEKRSQKKGHFFTNKKGGNTDSVATKGPL